VSELRANGLGVAAISYDSPEILADFSRRFGITFPLLSDTGSATIKQYGILNAAAAATPGREGIPFPGTFVVDRRQRVTSRFFEDSYVERNTTSSVMLKLGVGAALIAATRISTGQLDIETFASDTSIAPGNRLSLSVRIQPHARMHVYAPGIAGYRPVALTIAAQPFVRVLPLAYPPSEIYFFKPLNERVPVYQKPFTLVQDVVVEGTRDAQAAWSGKETVTLSGTLDYQACDDKVCFNPASVPLSWTLSLKPLVTERPATRQ